ncbi:MAG: hypothetical protein B0A82_22080 [Alkalinema sp. CACIAM 70d]|nr:MAG: hypothetical protein B0A82_22080 [Alkalinema sp. CACIAM 70d]
MNNSISGSLAGLLIFSTVVGVAAKPQAGMAQPKSVSLEAKLAKVAEPSPASVPQPAQEAVKVGEQQTPSRKAIRDESVAKIYSHELAGKQAATLYVRNIPVLTFVGSQPTEADGVKMGAVQVEELSPGEKTKAVSTNARGLADSASTEVSEQPNPSDPLNRASAIAAQINSLYQQGIAADKISVKWKAAKEGANAATQSEDGKFVVTADKIELVALDPQTISPDSQRDNEQDALQVANRLRRLFGEATPISQVEGKPNRPSGVQIAFGNVVGTIQGWASWYGPGFDGNYTASGEIFNQEALTAAHPSLPMGTRVRVTNQDTGRSVVVRINDRGPYHGGRILDLSAGAARLIGVMDSGVAPVRLDILGR